MPYEVELAPAAMRHLKGLPARQRAIALDGIQRHLVHEPTVLTRNRKPMRANPLAPWELRLGALRVYYDVVESPRPRVLVRAVGIKTRNVIRIGGKVYEL